MFSELIILLKKTQYHRMKYTIKLKLILSSPPSLHSDCYHDSKILGSKNRFALAFSLKSIFQPLDARAPIFGYFKEPCVMLNRQLSRSGNSRGKYCARVSLLLS